MVSCHHIMTCLRNGHAKFEAGKDLYLHPFDGDGMITAVTIQNGSALFRNRFVRTNVFNKERKARRVVSRGTTSPMTILA